MNDVYIYIYVCQHMPNIISHPIIHIYHHLPSSTHKHFQSHIPRRFPSPAQASLLLDQPCSFRSRSRCSRCSRSRSQSLPLRISRCSFSGVVAFSAASWSHGRNGRGKLEGNGGKLWEIQVGWYQSISVLSSNSNFLGVSFYAANDSSVLLPPQLGDLGEVFLQGAPFHPQDGRTALGSAAGWSSLNIWYISDSYFTWNFCTATSIPIRPPLSWTWFAIAAIGSGFCLMMGDGVDVHPWNGSTGLSKHSKTSATIRIPVTAIKIRINIQHRNTICI